MFEAEKRQAVEAAREYRARLAEIARDNRLSPQGKAEQEAAATVKYQTAVAKLQDLATARLDRQRAALPEKRKTATLAKAAYIGGILGEQVRFALLRERIAKMNGIRLVQAAREEGDDWAKAIMLESGKIAFADDPNTLAGLAEIEGKTKWGADVVQVDAEERELEQAAGIVPLLDVERARQDFAGRTGTREQFLPPTVPFPDAPIGG